MKIKGVIEDLKKSLKNDISKNISRNFSRAVVDSVGSVQFQFLDRLILLRIYRPFPM